jgi:O-antigen/teichoic acid export membrane protein
MTVRGALMRVVSIGSNLILIALVSPKELGLLAVVRGTLLILQYAAELGMSKALLRRPAEPTREEFAALAGLQALVTAVVLALGWVWPWLILGLGAIDRQWHGWMLAAVATMAVIPFGTGARVRLERALAYEKLAIVDVTNVLVQNVGFLIFALAGRFSLGVFVALAAATLAVNVMLYAWSPGPMPALDVGRLRALARQAGGFMAASWFTVAREYATPIVVAKLFGLPVAGLWAFAERFAQLLNVAFEGFRHATVPAAARLAHDPPSLRRLATNTLTGAASLAVPLVGLAFVSLPVLGIMWPRWEPAITLAQVYVLCYGIAGVAAASLEPVAVAVSGASAALAEQLSATLVAWVGFVLVRVTGVGTIAWVIPPMYVAPVVVLMVLTSREVRPVWDRKLWRLGLALATGLGLYAAGAATSAPAVATAAVASCGIVAWLRPALLLTAIVSKRRAVGA